MVLGGRWAPANQRLDWTGLAERRFAFGHGHGHGLGHGHVQAGLCGSVTRAHGQCG